MFFCINFENFQKSWKIFMNFENQQKSSSIVSRSHFLILMKKIIWADEKILLGSLSDRIFSLDSLLDQSGLVDSIRNSMSYFPFPVINLVATDFAWDYSMRSIQRSYVLYGAVEETGNLVERSPPPPHRQWNPHLHHLNILHRALLRKKSPRYIKNNHFFLIHD